MRYRLLPAVELRNLLPKWTSAPVSLTIIGAAAVLLRSLYTADGDFSVGIGLKTVVGAAAVYGICAFFAGWLCNRRLRERMRRGEANADVPSQEKVLCQLEEVAGIVDEKLNEHQMGELSRRLVFARAVKEQAVNIPPAGNHLTALRDSDWLLATSSVSPVAWADPGLACWLVMQGVSNVLALGRSSHGHLDLTKNAVARFVQVTEDTCCDLGRRLSQEDPGPIVDQEDPPMFWALRFIFVDGEAVERYTEILQSLVHLHFLMGIPCLVIVREKLVRALGEDALTLMRNLAQLTSQPLTFPPDVALVRRRAPEGTKLECWYMDSAGKPDHTDGAGVVGLAKDMFGALAEHADIAEKDFLTSPNYFLLTQVDGRPRYCKLPIDGAAEGVKPVA